MFRFICSSFLGALCACFPLQAGRSPEKPVWDATACAAEISADARVQTTDAQGSSSAAAALQEGALQEAMLQAASSETAPPAFPASSPTGHAKGSGDASADGSFVDQTGLQKILCETDAGTVEDLRPSELLHFVVMNPPVGKRLGHYLGYEDLDALRMVCRAFAEQFARSRVWVVNSAGDEVPGPGPLYNMFERAQVIHLAPQILMPTQKDIESDPQTKLTLFGQAPVAGSVAGYLSPWANKLAAARFFRVWQKHNFDPRMIRAQLPAGTTGVATYAQLCEGSEEAAPLPAYDTLVYGKAVAAVRSIPHDDALDNRLALSAVCPLGVSWRMIVFPAFPEVTHRLFSPDSVFWPMRKRIHETNEEFARIEEKRKNLPTDDRLKPLNQVVYDALMQAGDVASRETGATGRTLRQLRLLKLRSPAMPLAKVEPALAELSRYISLLDSDFVWVTDTHKGPYSLASLALLRGLPDILRVLCSADVQAALIDAAAQLSDPKRFPKEGVDTPA